MEFKTLKLDDICSVITDGSHSSPKASTNGYPMLSVKDMKALDFDYSNVKLIAEEDYTKLVKNGCKPMKDDVLIAKDGNSCLEYCFVFREPMEVVLLSSIAILRPKKNIINPYYLMYYLGMESTKGELKQGYLSGSAIPRVVLKDFKLYPVRFPSLDVQNKIVDLIKAINHKLESNEIIISNLEQLAQTLFKRWFVDFEFPNENGDPYKSSGGEMVESELGMIPANWTIEKLGDVTEIQNGFAFKSKDYVKDGIKVLRTLNINSAGMIINNDDLKYLPQAFYSDDKYQKQQLKRFDSLLVMVGSTIGKLGLVLSRNLPSLQNQNMWRFRSKNDKLSNTILYFYLKEVIIATENWRSGSAREFFRKDSFSKYEIVMPDDSFLISNRNMFVKIFEQIDGCNSQNEVLNDLRDILLPKLLSGEIELPEETEVTEDVPIS
ncbi:type I restriction modification protein [Kurthia zopfii]|uniref:EcoKI restriction-modification system protein HsdS n=1 Tax=Kurthia zopfii TaxID=1650 RepID=A0A8B4QDM2_9BACL|nr:restriction endonuclease subunit S [Kurthia zopfii]PWI22726.1 restriction endonuclease subunit S [Kurthia zopfii]TDR39527.1 type I restriction enzyme S subunit [Kurthia zopfii]GEK32109.1 type I restriction modification protein [Kurthia zopfii]STX10836.1 EcoKI restriction-modification system protein HsdS [Kurthia zopfii]